MQGPALFFRQRALACFHRRRRQPLLSTEWRHEAGDECQFILRCRATGGVTASRITRTAYALGPRVRLPIGA